MVDAETMLGVWPKNEFKRFVVQKQSFICVRHNKIWLNSFLQCKSPLDKKQQRKLDEKVLKRQFSKSMKLELKKQN